MHNQVSNTQNFGGKIQSAGPVCQILSTAGFANGRNPYQICRSSLILIPNLYLVDTTTGLDCTVEMTGTDSSPPPPPPAIV